MNRESERTAEGIWRLAAIEIEESRRFPRTQHPD
jgi:hypothetical protein